MVQNPAVDFSGLPPTRRPVAPRRHSGRSRLPEGAAFLGAVLMGALGAFFGAARRRGSSDGVEPVDAFIEPSDVNFADATMITATVAAALAGGLLATVAACLYLTRRTSTLSPARITAMLMAAGGATIPAVVLIVPLAFVGPPLGVVIGLLTTAALMTYGVFVGDISANPPHDALAPDSTNG